MEIDSYICLLVSSEHLKQMPVPFNIHAFNLYFFVKFSLKKTLIFLVKSAFKSEKGIFEQKKRINV